MNRSLRVLRRFFSTELKEVSLCSLLSRDDGLAIKIVQNQKSSELTIPLVWLRDHCRSSTCYNSPTNQRKSNLVQLFEESELRTIDVEGDVIKIIWKDGHKSRFPIKDLLKDSVLTKSDPFDQTLWNSLSLKSIPTLSIEEYTFEKLCKQFVDYGVVIVEGIEHNAESTEKFCREVAPIHDTYFGAFWVFSNEAQTQENEEYHEDTAYGQEAIGPHTDGTYFDQTPGIQVFHCLHPASRGGETVLADGWKCANELRRSNPAAFKLLSEKKVRHHYIERGVDGNALHTVCEHRPVIELDENGHIVQLRFNPYDRAPMNWLNANDGGISAKETLEFYKAYSDFSKICHDPVNSVQISLKPGSVIFIDNFRILHSRTEFEGYRQMAGCYLSRDNFMAKARPFQSKKND